MEKQTITFLNSPHSLKTEDLCFILNEWNGLNLKSSQWTSSSTNIHGSIKMPSSMFGIQTTIKSVLRAHVILHLVKSVSFRSVKMLLLIKLLIRTQPQIFHQLIFILLKKDTLWTKKIISSIFLETSDAQPTRKTDSAVKKIILKDSHLQDKAILMNLHINSMKSDSS